jgi:hydroxymethylbilane synthase
MRVALGTRASALARWQTEHVASHLAAAIPGIEFDIVEIVSTGDTVTDLPLTEVEGTGFFTATIERALLAGDIDVAVHSYKDLPVETTPDLVVAAVPERGPVEDALCARDGLTLATLAGGARVGTCSARRTAQVRAIRSDLHVVPLRGNVPTRIERVTGGDFDAVVLARAGLVRLGLERCITEVFPIERVLPAPAQGALAVQCRANDVWLRNLVAVIDHAATRRAVDAERTLLHALGGGCSVPVGAVARCDGPRVTLMAGVFAHEPKNSLRIQADGEDPRALGESAAKRLLAQGAGGILASFDKAARIGVPATTGEGS